MRGDALLNKDSPLQHIYYDMYQYYIWRNATQPILNIKGFTENNGNVSLKWTTLPVAPDSILLFVNCECGIGCKIIHCLCCKSCLMCTKVLQMHQLRKQHWEYRWLDWLHHFWPIIVNNHVNSDHETNE